MLLRHTAASCSPAEHPGAVVGEHLLAAGIELPRLRLPYPLGIVIHLHLQLLLLQLGLRLHLLFQHSLMLLLLVEHLRLHSLLAWDHIPRLVRIIGGVLWLCEGAKGQQRRQNQ